MNNEPVNWWEVFVGFCVILSVVILTFLSCFCIWTGHPLNAFFASFVTFCLLVATIAVLCLFAAEHGAAIQRWMDKGE